MSSPSDIRETVREKYAERAVQVIQTDGGGYGPSCCRTKTSDPITSDLYSADEAALLPDTAVLASLGCGNPTALAELHPGDTVLDLGSGGGIDVLLSERRVGPSGKAYGLDMTDEMLELAEANKVRSGQTNVEFLKGDIAHVPLPDASVDVVISNCVVNLSGDKPQVLREAARVLKPGGRFAVSDVIADPGMDADTRADMAQWTGCVAGALTEAEFRAALADAGLTVDDVDVVAALQQLVHEVRADESGAAGHECAHGGGV